MPSKSPQPVQVSPFKGDLDRFPGVFGPGPGIFGRPGPQRAAHAGMPSYSINSQRKVVTLDSYLSINISQSKHMLDTLLENISSIVREASGLMVRSGFEVHEKGSHENLVTSSDVAVISFVRDQCFITG